jgi:hypothetical protein
MRPSALVFTCALTQLFIGIVYAEAAVTHEAARAGAAGRRAAGGCQYRQTRGVLQVPAKHISNYNSAGATSTSTIHVELTTLPHTQATDSLLPQCRSPVVYM